MSGLGLDEFLQFDRNTKRKFVGNWKDDGEIIVWLSTRASFAYPRWVHTFPHLDTFKDEKKGEVEYLRFGRFVSPDSHEINKSQFFRGDGDRLELPPVKDPFLLLREWLRSDDCGFGLDDVIFRFVNPKRGEKDIEWSRAAISGLEKRAKWNWNHSLDSKLEYMFVVVVDDKPEDGLQIISGSKLLGDSLRKEIEAQRDSEGHDKGNPLINPYAFKFKYDKNARSAMDSYTAKRYNRAECTDEILALIQDYDFPSPEQDMAPRKGDKEKIRAAMYEAAENAGVDLPWDEFFVDAWDDGGGGSSGGDDSSSGDARRSNANRGGGRTRQASQSSGGRTRQASQSSGGRTRQDERGESAASRAGKPGRRRLKQQPPQQPPAEPTEPCELCDEPLPLSATKCHKCGALYESEETEAGAREVVDDADMQAADKCWSCGSDDIQGTECGSCGIDLTDDIPI